MLGRLGAGATSASGKGGSRVQALFTAAKATPLIDAMQWHMAARETVR